MLFPALRFLAEPADNCVYERKGDNTMRFFRFLFFTFILLWMLIGCRQTTSPPVKSDITLTAEFTGVTEAWIAVHNPEPQTGTVLQLWRGEQLVFSGGGSITDTTVADSGLAPAQSYRYRARLLKDGALLRTGPELTISTMDTTSHDFTWEVIEFPSPFGSGGLYDVAIINENDIWAVGEIYSDSAKPWLPFNAVHWDGEKWELVRITYGEIPWPIRTIFAFNSNEIWFDAFVKWNGTNFIELPIPDVLIGAIINKSWGTSGNDFYIVGNNGLIAHYNGSNWRRIESGTTLPIQDIWGAWNEKTGLYEILSVASAVINNYGMELLEIKEGYAEKISTDGLSWSLKAIWFIPGVFYTIGGDGFYITRHYKKRWKKINMPFLYKHAARGQAVNDIIVAGSFGFIAHFNGMSWRFYNGGHFPSMGAAYRGVAIRDNVVAAVGYYNSRNVIISIGKRK